MKYLRWPARSLWVVGLGLWLLNPNSWAQAPGAKLWEFKTEGQMNSSPAIGPDGVIYVGAGQLLYALNANGTQRWRYKVKGLIYSSPAVGLNGQIFFGSLDHRVYGLNDKGGLDFSYSTGGPVRSSPAVETTGTLYVGSDDGYLHALTFSGKKKWAFSTGGYVRSSPAIGADGTIYVGSWDNRLYALTPDGALKWTFPTRHYVYSSPAIGPDGTIYVGSVDNWLYALDTAGKVKWSLATEGHIYSSPALGADGTVYVGSWDNKLYAVDSRGTLRWAFATGNLVQSSPALGADGSICFGSDENKLYCLNPDGTKRWTFTSGSIVRSSPVIAPDGTIYFGSEDSRLYAIKSGVGPVVSSWPMFRGDARHRGKVLLVIMQQPQAQSVVVENEVQFEVVASGAGRLGYQWRFMGTNLSGASGSILHLTNVQPAQAGDYSVMVTNQVETVASSPANLTVIVPPLISLQPQSQTVVEGAFVSFRVQAESRAPLTYQWFFKGTNLPGITNSILRLAEAHPANDGEYHVVLQNAAGLATSAVARLTVVNPPQIVVQPQPLTVPLGANAQFSVTAHSLSALTYQWRFNTTNLPTGTASNLMINQVQIAQAGAYSAVLSNLAGAITSAVATLTVATPPVISGPPTNQVVAVGGKALFNVSASSQAPLTYQWRFENTNLPDATNAQLVLEKPESNRSGGYSVVVSNLAGVVTSSPVVLSVLSPPVIIQSPVNQTSSIGGELVFKVTAKGSSPLEYSWFFQQAGIPGATNSSLRLSQLQPSESGNYVVVVSNAVGAVTSAPATLVVPARRSLGQWLKSWF
jgi:outer membrane protein assembly factor BamB